MANTITLYQLHIWRISTITKFDKNVNREHNHK